MRTLAAYLALSCSTLRRSPLRTLLTLVGIAAAVSVFLTITAFYGGYRSSLETTVEKMGYEILVTARGCPYESATLVMRGGNIPMYVDEKIFDLIERDADVARTSRLFMQGTPVSAGNRFQVFLGVDDGYRDLKPWMTLQRGRWFSSMEANEVVLGYSVAEFLRADLGDKVPAGPGGIEAEVVGVFDRSGTQDDGFIFLPLTSAQKAFDRQGKLTGIAVKLTEIGSMDGFIDRTFEIPSVQVITLAQVRQTILDLVGSARLFINATAIVAILVAILGVFNTTMMSVMERTFEFGVMKVAGASPVNIFATVCLEVGLLCLTGGLAGEALAWIFSGLAEAVVRDAIPYAPAGTLIRFTPALLLAGIAGSLLTGIVAGLYPAARAALSRPIRSIRGTA